MDKKEKINQLIEEAFNSVDNVKKAGPMPFLLTRIHAKLNKTPENLWEKTGRFIGRPSFAIPGLAVLILLNVVTVFFSRDATTSFPLEQSAVAPSDEYAYSIATIYDIENTEP